MPMYQRKPFKAQQINNRTDCPHFAWDIMQEAFGDHDFCLVKDGKTTYGNYGDYVCQRPDGKAIYICSRETFEACNNPIEEVQGGGEEIFTLSLDKLRELFMGYVASGNFVRAATIGLLLHWRENGVNHDVLNENAFQAFRDLKSK